MNAKNTEFSTKTTLNCNGLLLDISKPAVMGIINTTPDSFYQSAKKISVHDVLILAEKMIKEGAAILDVGGMSSRPGATFVEEEEELVRVIPAIEAIHSHFPNQIISIDTCKSRVAHEAIFSGASMVNDISAGAFDKNLWQTVAALKVPYVLMHMQGTPATMQAKPTYYDVVKEVVEFFKQNIFRLNSFGIFDIILDPGFGFGKTVSHNYKLLNQFEIFNLFGLPLMAGLSRKSLICKVLKVNPAHALNGTTVLNTLSLLKGAKILRVHDVMQAQEAIKLIEALDDAAI
jgi:dihydropteroate synthase